MPAELVAIGDGPIRVELLPEVGARLHRLQAFGHDLLRTPADPAEHARDPYAWGAYVMAPWCNRTTTAPTRIDGHVLRLTPNFPDGTAIHGQVAAVPWHVVADGTFSVRGGEDEWPWPYECRLRVRLEGATLAIELGLTNQADSPMPAGLGLHPWFRRPLEVRIGADQVVRSNLDPAATLEAVDGPFDLRAMRAIPDGLDAAWLATSDPALEMHWPDLGVAAVVRVGSEAPHWIAAASLPGFDAVAIEPQTHAAYGLRRFLAGEAGGLQLVGPGDTLALRIELAFHAFEPGRSAPSGG